MVKGETMMKEETMHKKIERDTLGDLSRATYREWARRCIEIYSEGNMLVDAIVWQQIIEHFDAELAEARAGLAEARAELAESRQREAIQDEIMNPEAHLR
jgi:hypothetical protein